MEKITFKEIEIKSINCVIKGEVSDQKYLKPKLIKFIVSAEARYLISKDYGKIEFKQYESINCSFAVYSKNLLLMNDEHIYNQAMYEVHSWLYHNNTELYLSGVKENLIRDTFISINKIEIKYCITLDNVVTIKLTGFLDILHNFTTDKKVVMIVKTEMDVLKSELNQVDLKAKDVIKKHIKKLYPELYKQSITKGTIN